MACFPKIDQPCPLGIDEQKRIDGYCSRCAKTVHALDMIGDTERRALLSKADGSICVSYRRPVVRGLGAGLGAALAMSVSVSASALAIDVLPSASATEPAQSSVEKERSTLLGEKSDGPKCDEAAKAAAAGEPLPLEMSVMVGGVSNPADAEWVDDSDLPDLPMINALALPNL